MNRESKARLLSRLNEAWPQSPYRPVDVELEGRVSYLVTFRHEATHEAITRSVSCREVRMQERRLRLLASGMVPVHPENAPAVNASGVEQAQEASVKPLACGPDTIVASVRLLPVLIEDKEVKSELSESLQAELMILKEVAQQDEEEVPTRWSFCGQPLIMQPKGGQHGFLWILKNSKITLAISRGVKTGVVGQVRLWSEYLWEYRSDLMGALVKVNGLIEEFFGPDTAIQLSSVDLAMDFMGWDIASSDVFQNFVTRAILDDRIPESEAVYVEGPDRAYRRWKRLETINFGKKSSPLFCRLYDKTKEIKYQSQEKEWMYDVYGSAYDGESPVYRLEFSVGRAVLGDMDISDWYDLPGLQERLWQYCVGLPDGGEDGRPTGWLRYTTPTEDSNRSRWPVHPNWRVIQASYTNELEVPEMPPLVRERKRAVNLDRLLKQITGCVTTVEAWRPPSEDGCEPDLSSTFGYVYANAERLLEEKQERDKRHRDFSGWVAYKRDLYSMVSSDTSVAA